MKRIRVHREYMDGATQWEETEYDFQDNHPSTVTEWRWRLWVVLERGVNRIMHRLEKLLLDTRPLA